MEVHSGKPCNGMTKNPAAVFGKVFLQKLLSFRLLVAKKCLHVATGPRRTTSYEFASFNFRLSRPGHWQHVTPGNRWRERWIDCTCPVRLAIFSLCRCEASGQTDSG